MKFYKLIMNSRRVLALLLSLFMMLSLVGCTSDDIADGLELAGDIVDLFDPVVSDSAPTVESAPPITDESSGTEAPSITDESAETETQAQSTADTQTEALLDEDGYYYSKDEVALYIHTYGKLPSNFITKDEAEDLGWEGGSVQRYLEGAAIGGDKFGNREGLLPKKNGRTYFECDIDTDGKSSRGAKRIVFSNDGLIYYTNDHYETFTLLYGEEQETG